MAEKASWAVGSDTERIVDVEDARAATSGLLAPSATIAGRTGFLAGPATQGQVTASGTPDANVHVAAFQAALPNSRGTFPYIVTLDAPKTLDVLVANPSDPTNPRHDLIIAQQSDAYYGDASSPFEVVRVTGTPAASPSDPAVPGSPDYFTLARITVTAGATTITSGMITDLRPAQITVARGAVLPCTSSTRPTAPYGGMTIFETDTGKFRARNATTSVWEEVFTATSNQMTTDLPLRITNSGDVSLTSTSHAFQIGPTSGQNFRVDGEEMQAVNNGATSTLRVNPIGGLVRIGSGGLDVDGDAVVNGTFTADTTSTFSGTATITPAASANSKPLAFNHAYGINVDNVAADGSAGTRLWIDTPNDGDVVIGPRGGSDFINSLRLRTDSPTGNAANLYINSTTYQISRSTSSLRYKTDVEDLDLDLDAVRALRPVRFRDKHEVEQDPTTTQTYVGLIAEEVHDAGLHNFVHYMEDENGELTPDGVQYDRLTVALHLLVSDLADTVTAKTAEITALQAALASLEQRVADLEAA